jgi:hypothetical protein
MFDFPGFAKQLLKDNKRSIQWLADELGKTRSSTDRMLNRSRWYFDEIVEVGDVFGLSHNQYINGSKKSKDASHV